jgi:hypothetical protein
VGFAGNPVGYLIAAVGAATGLTGLFGFCPACAMAGRRIGERQPHVGRCRDRDLPERRHVARDAWAAVEAEEWTPRRRKLDQRDVAREANRP